VLEIGEVGLGLEALSVPVAEEDVGESGAAALQRLDRRSLAVPDADGLDVDAGVVLLDGAGIPITIPLILRWQSSAMPLNHRLKRLSRNRA
jgi:hypothetical protein